MPYGDDAGFAQWMDDYGYVLPDNSPTLSVLRRRGSSYLDGTYEGVWTGRRTDGVMQELGWPRTGAKLGCVTAIPDDVIPLSVVDASYRAAWLEAATPGTLSSSASSGQRVQSEQVDVLKVSYFDDKSASVGSGSVAFVDGEIDGLMRAFVCDETGGLFFQAIGT